MSTNNEDEPKCSSDNPTTLAEDPVQCDCGCASTEDPVLENKPEETKCPPMPSLNIPNCRPAWLCSPPKVMMTKNYPVPDGVTILPISIGGRYGCPTGDDSSSSGVGELSSCGGEPKPELSTCGGEPEGPELSPNDCPMMKPKCPVEEPGFFSRMTSFFTSTSTTKEECEEIVEDSQPESQEGDQCEEQVDQPTIESQPPNLERQECEGVNEPPAPTEPNCIDDPERNQPLPQDNQPGSQLGGKCECANCKIQDPEDCSFLPDRDDRDVSVRASEWMEEACNCPTCTTLPMLDENGEPIPVTCPNVTCGECGYIRGQNSVCCRMCQFGLKMKEEGDYLRNRLNQCQPEEEVVDEEKVDKCSPEVDPDMVPFEWSAGKPVYEGGMTITRTQRYLWQQGLCDGEGFRALAVEGQTLRVAEDGDEECICGGHMERAKYRGGMTLDESLEWLWIKNKALPTKQSSGDENDP